MGEAPGSDEFIYEGVSFKYIHLISHWKFDLIVKELSRVIAASSFINYITKWTLI
jgi:hypothetical protein